MADWMFEPLIPLSYEVLVVDPPWQFKHRSEKGQLKSAANQYDVMSLEDIAAMPVGKLAQRDCLLMLWSTGAMQPQALDVMAAWGFTFKSQIIWRKTTVNGKVRMGTGYWARSMHEPVLIGTMGSPSRHLAFPSLFDGVAREHSRKPEEFYDLVNKHTRAMRKADLFSRVTRPGFDGWGLEANKFDEVA